MKPDLPGAPLLPLTDALEFLLCGIDPSGRLAVVNQRCSEVTGIERHTLLGQDFCALFANGAVEQVKALWSTATASSEPARFEALCRNGRRVRWQFSHWPYRQAPGVCAIGEDVTQESREQIRRRMRDRITGLSNLGAGIAHELRNPLNSATLQLEVLLRRLAVPGQEVATLSNRASLALVEIRRAAALIDDFLRFARPEPLRFAVIDLGKVAETAVAACRDRAQRAGVRLTTQPAAPLPTCIDADRVDVALRNLIANGIDAAAGSITPEVEVCWFGEPDSVVVEVGDSGPGLPSLDAPIFDPFFTTKSDGTGLGLSIVERVAADHGGTIHVERRGDSTVFVLSLPRMAEPAAAGE